MTSGVAFNIRMAVAGERLALLPVRRRQQLNKASSSGNVEDDAHPRLGPTHRAPPI